MTAEIINASQSGGTTQDGLERLDKHLKPNIDIFILELGINDAFRAVNRLLAAGEDVRRLKEPFEADGVSHPLPVLFTVFASSTLHLSPVAISVLIIASGVIAFPAYLAGGSLSDRFGRRSLGVVLTAAYTIFAALGFVSGTLGFIAGNVLWSAFASAATPVMGAWSGELYPTRARATGGPSGSAVRSKR